MKKWVKSFFVGGKEPLCITNLQEFSPTPFRSITIVDGDSKMPHRRLSLCLEL